MIERPKPRQSFRVGRRSRLAWCESHGVPALKPGGTTYDGSDAQGNSLVADDADVTVIAGQLARLCLDTLVSNQQVSFPYPAYAIGLKRGWIFTEALEIWPIELSNATNWETSTSESNNEDALAFLHEIIPEIPNDKA